MPKKDGILNLPSLSIKKCVGFNSLTLAVSYRRKAVCIHCGNRHLRKKSRYVRKVWHESIGLRRTLLLIDVYKYHCRCCGRYFNQRFPGILPYQRSTERLKEQVYEYHTQGVSNSDLAKQLEKGKATIERWYHQYYQRHHGERGLVSCPKVVGIDEHRFSRKSRYATTLCDLQKHKVFEVVKGRSSDALSSYLNQLQAKERVQVVCMDLSVSYRSLVAFNCYKA